MAVVDADEQEAQAEDARVSCDPAITVADLESALDAFFTAVGYRNLQEIVDQILDSRCTWKTAPKARP